MLSLSRPLRPIDYSLASLASKASLAAIRESRPEIKKFLLIARRWDIRIESRFDRDFDSNYHSRHMYFINWTLDDY